MSTSIPFHRSLLGRALIFGVLPSVLVMASVVTINAQRAMSRFSATLERDLRRATELAAEDIGLRNEATLNLVRMMARTQETGMFGQRAQTLRFIERTAKSDNDIYAAYIAYEPNGDGQDGAGAQPGVPAQALGAGGRFYPYFKRDPKNAGAFVLESLQENPQDGGLWYRVPKERFDRSGVADASITKPYSYMGVDIIEHVMPIVIDGQFKGIAGMDASLATIQSRLDRIAKELDADVFLETRGFFIAATSDARGGALRNSKVADSKMGPLFDLASDGNASLQQLADPDTGEPCYFVAVRVKDGAWRLLVRKPSSAATHELWGMLMLNFATAGFGIVVLVALLGGGSMQLARRVRAAQALAERIAAGDLSSDATMNSNHGASLSGGGDETTELTRAMTRMNQDLAGIVGAVRSASTRLAATSAQLAATSREQEATTRGFGGSTAQIASAIREIAATGTELAQSTEAIDAGARRTADAAKAGRVGLDAMAVSMRRLDLATGDIGEHLQVISEKAESINSVVETISKVAEQTNLLSVNAAIEAEKAGDAGLGFLVVAREIRRLADQTASASLDIERIVHQMQGAVSSGVRSMAGFTSEMRGSSSNVQRIANDMSGIMSEMNAVFESFSGVQRGMSSQAIGVRQIDEAVVQVAAGAQQTVVSVGEFGRVADELAHAVAVLQDAVARFQLDEHNVVNSSATPTGTGRA
ncbi:MAG: methyl-accepting chemotaxis protein [Planctomycetota bacterium]|nr:MAG: methyl-accepting chemotaxis protein [Planctomycetota bacterium]